MTEQIKISFDPLNSLGKKDSMPCIGVFGRKNFGKSSFVNLLADGELALVSKLSGTTKEPSKFSFNINNIGNVTLIDTSGIDDYGEAGEKRVSKTLETLKIIDLAIILITGNVFAEPEKILVNKLLDYSIPFIVVHNKSDLQELSDITRRQVETAYQTKLIEFSCTDPVNLSVIISNIKNFIPDSAFESKSILGKIVSKNDLIILAVPDQISAPDGKITLSQIEITRDLLDNNCLTLFVKQKELSSLLSYVNPKPVLTILPTSLFNIAAELLPLNMQLTSYGVVMAQYKGDLNKYIEDTPKLNLLSQENRILFIQSSTDNTSPEFKEQEELPLLISNHLRKNIEFVSVNISDISNICFNQYDFIIICGSSLLTSKQMKALLATIMKSGVPVSTYDMVNALIHGVFYRATAPFIK
ncbi:MAG: GTP-binding protein [Bacteroidetes bacterium]|nr:GTP-binding protein [Bacteroidota bacterium]